MTETRTDISKGRRFEHKFWLYPGDYANKTPLVCEITAVRQGCVYYRPVYHWPDRPIGEQITLGKAMYCTLESFEPKYLGKWL